MKNDVNRRFWLKKVGLGVAGLGLVSFDGLGHPVTDDEITNLHKTPIYLNANENPYGPSPLAVKAMETSVKHSNKYGFRTTPKLISAIAEHNNVTASNILLDAGSTKILNTILLHTAFKGGNYVIAKNTFDYWTSPAKNLGLQKISVPLTKNKKHDLNGMLNAITSETSLVYICNPNNPTGTICDSNELLSFVSEASKKTLVLIDEAYIDLTSQPSLSKQVLTNKNVIIAKTFSKLYGMAGARIGYAVAHSDTIIALKKIQSWPNGGISITSVSGALASLNDKKFTSAFIETNKKVRAYTIEQLERLKISCIPSHTNFIYFSLENYKGDFFSRLKSKNIHGTRIYEETGKWSRITVGTQQEMEVFINALM